MKNFSRNRKESLRNENDFYQTPQCLVQTFINKHYNNLPNIVADLCCGEYAIGNVLRKNNIKVVEKDIIYGDDIFDEKETFKNRYNESTI